MAADGLTLDIDTSEINELLKQFPEYQNIVFNETEVAMVSSLFMFQELIQGKTPVGVTGNLRQSFIPTRPIQRGQLLTGSVATFIPYGLRIERGEPQKKFSDTDMKSLELWVIRKLNVPQDRAASVAFLIARKIMRTGQYSKPQGWRMVEQAFEEGSPKSIKLFNLATQRAADKIETKIEAID